MTELIVSVVTLSGVAFTAFITWLVAQRQIKARHITAERTKWRNDIRRLTRKICQATSRDEIDQLGRELQVRLNPYDQKDQMILEGIGGEEFVERIALLLKHDWERVKMEVGFSPWRYFVAAKRLEPSDAKELRRCASCCRWKTYWKTHGIQGSRVCKFIAVAAAAILIIYFCPPPRWCPWG